MKQEKAAVTKFKHYKMCKTNNGEIKITMSSRVYSSGTSADRYRLFVACACLDRVITVHCLAEARAPTNHGDSSKPIGICYIFN